MSSGPMFSHDLAGAACGIPVRVDRWLPKDKILSFLVDGHIVVGSMEALQKALDEHNAQWARVNTVPPCWLKLPASELVDEADVPWASAPAMPDLRTTDRMSITPRVAGDPRGCGGDFTRPGSPHAQAGCTSERCLILWP